MFKDTKAFSGFSVNDLQKAKEFYGDLLGIDIQDDIRDDREGLHLHINGGIPIFVYEKANHEPATYTILNFPVNSIEDAYEQLQQKGITFEIYEGMTDENGIAWGARENRGPNIAWFKDPAGNILSILSDS